MLVVTANWCVSDGTLSALPPRWLLDRFRAEVRRSSLRCGFRHDGRYRPVEAIDVVFAGDTFDWLVSREWTADTRPWDDGRKAAATRERVAAAAARRGRRLLATLAGWMRQGIPVPTADRRGRPSPVLRTVPVRVTLLSGDRDRWLEQAACGRAGPPGEPAVGTCWSDGEVTVQHGERLDPLHAARGRQPTLGESLAVDLIAAFGGALHDSATLRPLAAGLLRRLAGGCHVDAASRLIGWLAARERGAMLPRAARQELIDAWHRAVALWHRAARRLPPNWGDGVDLVGHVAACLEIRDDVADACAWQSPGWFPTMPAELASDGAATIVLGHPPAGGRTVPAGKRHVVCLGPEVAPAVGPQVGPCADGFANDLDGPAAVVLRAGREGRLIDWLPLAGTAGGDGDADDRRRTREGANGVWLSGTSWSGHGIVDAA